MKWYHFIAAFFAGAFLANAVPHFVNGVSGDPFPSPFSDPPGQGLSSPVVNVLWGSLNLLVGYLLLITSKASPQNKWLLLVLFIGVVVMAVMLGDNFAHKLKV
jgi:hypothetical protein